MYEPCQQEIKKLYKTKNRTIIFLDFQMKNLTQSWKKLNKSIKFYESKKKRNVDDISSTYLFFTC